MQYIQFKSKLMQQHFQHLGEVGNQAAEKAMQRRQQLLAQQQQWVQGDQGSKVRPFCTTCYGTQLNMPIAGCPKASYDRSLLLLENC